MQIQIHYEGMDHTPWMEQFIKRQICKLNRYLGKLTVVETHLQLDREVYKTVLIIRSNSFHETFSGQGENLYESFSLAIEDAVKSLADRRRKTKRKINQKLHTLDNDSNYFE